MCNGQTFRSLRAASNVLGVSAQTLRSRLHRAKQLGRGTVDVGQDRRRRSSSVQRRPRSRILLPDLRTGQLCLNATEFARLSKLPKATVLHRWHQIALSGQNPSLLAPADLHRRLTTPVQRQHSVTLRLPSGRRLSGGVRKVVKTFLADAESASVKLRLSESGIRRRLRRVMPTQNQPELQWAFGLSDVAED